MYYKGFLKVLNLRVLAPASRLALIIRASLVLHGFSGSSEFARVGSAVAIGFVIIWAWLVLQGFLKILNLQVLAPPSYRGWL